MRIYDILEKKRDGGELNTEEIYYVVDGGVHGYIPDYQISAFLMAVFFRGMTDNEISDLTTAMAHSGRMLEFGKRWDKTVDKHSSGGVGDKVTLIAAPIAASLGCCVPKMSGRGLGHTGGTLDKLESIPGFKTALSEEEFVRVVEKCGMAVVGQTADITPADKKFYAIRDVTATVDSIPLIASSIMSKKISSGAENVVLDVTVGSGAFMKDIVSARILAEKMVSIGKRAGIDTIAYITNMDEPLGNAVGNSLEVIEAAEVLRGGGPEDLKTIAFSISAGMVAVGLDLSYDEAMSKVIQSVDSGCAMHKFRQWITAQGGDPGFTDDSSILPRASVLREYTAAESGYLSHMNAELVGKSSSVLGAGRETYDDIIDHSAGILFVKKAGEYINKGDVIAYLHTSDDSLIAGAEQLLDDAITYSDTQPERKPVIYDRVD